MEKEKQELTVKTLYAQLVLRLTNIVFRPALEWRKIHREDKSFNDIISEFSLPLIGICTFITFLSILINQSEINFEMALKGSMALFLALFGGLYLSFLILERLLPMFLLPNSKTLAFRIVAYASAPLYIVTFIVSLAPDFFFLHLASFYGYVLIWLGIDGFPGIKKEQKLTVSLIITVLILFLPFFVHLLFQKLISF